MSGIVYQLYSSRHFPPLRATLAMLADLGYAGVEGYGALFQDTASLDALEQALGDTGLSMPSAHFGWPEVQDDPERVLSIAHRLGIKTVVVPYLEPDARPGDSEGWQAFGQALAAAGEPIRQAGLGFAWHNHDFEFVRLDDGTRPLDHILAGSDALRLEADLAWVVRAGSDPLALLDRYGDRLAAVHVKDIAPSGLNLDEDGWADVGHGVVDWTSLLNAIRHRSSCPLIVEHDNPSDDRRFARRSMEALTAMLASAEEAGS